MTHMQTQIDRIVAAHAREVRREMADIRLARSRRSGPGEWRRMIARLKSVGESPATRYAIRDGHPRTRTSHDVARPPSIVPH